MAISPPPGVPPAPGPSNEDLWKQYRLLVDLQKHYLEQTLKFNVFYYAITGAALSYYLAHREYTPLLWVTPVFLALMSLLFALVFFFGASRNGGIRAELQRITKRLQLLEFPETRVLTLSLLASGALFIAVTIGMLAMLLALEVYR